MKTAATSGGAARLQAVHLPLAELPDEEIPLTEPPRTGFLASGMKSAYAAGPLHLSLCTGALGISLSRKKEEEI